MIVNSWKPDERRTKKPECCITYRETIQYSQTSFLSERPLPSIAHESLLLWKGSSKLDYNNWVTFRRKTEISIYGHKLRINQSIWFDKTDFFRQLEITTWFSTTKMVRKGKVRLVMKWLVAVTLLVADWCQRALRKNSSALVVPHKAHRTFGRTAMVTSPALASCWGKSLEEEKDFLGVILAAVPWWPSDGHHTSRTHICESSAMVRTITQPVANDQCSWCDATWL